jgi:hypothetical protein
MNRRVLLLIGFLFVVCLTTLWGVWGQRNQLAGLRAEQRQLLSQQASNSPASLTAADAGAALSGTPPPALVVTPELLRLRSEVTRLTERRRELEGVRAENERLLARVASRGTNGPGGFQLPPGYIRKSEARMVGYNSLDDTLQSLLWAARNHDLTNLLQAFTPEGAEELRAQAGESRESIKDFFSKSAALVGMRVVKREQAASDGSVAVEVEVMPDMPLAQISFRQINGQWKIARPF